MRRYGITSGLERAHFLAQVGHESGDYYYKAELWGPTPTQTRYEGRSDLGNSQPGDGKKFKGRGYIQITGRANYKGYNNYLVGIGDNVDVLNNEDVVETEKYAADSAGYWWKNLSRNISRLALAGSTPRDVELVSIRVNGKNRRTGTANGLADRQAKFDAYWAEIQADPTAYA